ncbi:MAG: hypothetical protein ACPL7B_08890, partial [Candidatus Poribacteria bacterium]
MVKEKKAKVGLLGLMLQLYDRYPEIKPAMVEFANELIGTMSSFADVIFPGVCNTRQLVNVAIDEFE